MVKRTYADRCVARRPARSLTVCLSLRLRRFLAPRSPRSPICAALASSTLVTALAHWYLATSLRARISLTNGAQPTQIGLLTALTDLLAPGVNWPALPSEIGHLTKLSRIDVQQGSVQRIPSQLGNIQSLRHLMFFGNKLETLPSELAQLTDLNYFNTLRNPLHGRAPQFAASVECELTDARELSACLRGCPQHCRCANPGCSLLTTMTSTSRTFSSLETSLDRRPTTATKLTETLTLTEFERTETLSQSQPQSQPPTVIDDVADGPSIALIVGPIAAVCLILILVGVFLVISKKRQRADPVSINDSTSTAREHSFGSQLQYDRVPMPGTQEPAPYDRVANFYENYDTVPPVAAVRDQGEYSTIQNGQTEYGFGNIPNQN